MFCFATTYVVAQPPSGYYNTALGKQGAELKTALYNIIKGHTVVSYSALYSHYQHTDIKPNGKVWDMYSNCDFSWGENCGSYSQECDCFNREHSLPQSWFNSASPMVSDIFHVYPTDGYVNGRRSNFPYGEVNSATYTSGNGCKLGSCVFPGYTGTVFEPIDEYKGDFARTYFYMVTRYENVISNWNAPNVLNGTTFPAFTEWQLNLLISWHNQDPVSDKEINRNNYVYTSVQHNRNPFIDHPEFVAAVWGGSVVSVTGVTLSPTSISLNIGETSQLTATVSPSNATNKNITWSSSNNSVATVSNSGLVSAVSQGNATITVTTVDGNFTATANVSVTNSTVSVTGVTLSPTSLSLNIGGTSQLTATVLPANATNKLVSWSSSNNSVVTVSNSGLITAISVGNAIITVTTVDGNKTATANISVTTSVISVTGVTLSPTSLSLNIGGTSQLTATVLPANATNKLVSWSSSNNSVVTVSNSGLITAISVGNAIITVTTVDGNKTATANISVTTSVISVTGVTLSPTSLSLNIGGTSQLTATVLPANATNKLVSWTSSNNLVATVSNSGLVSAISVGNATISVTTQDGNKTATANISVISPNHLPQISSTPVKNAVSETQYIYSITATDSDVNDSLIFSATKPSWLNFTDNKNRTATLSGTPTNENEGANSVSISVTDSKSQPVTQNFVIIVEKINHAPSFTSIPQTDTLLVGDTFSYQIVTQDVDNDEIMIQCTKKSSWLEFSESGNGKAILRGIPEVAGTFEVILKVTDRIATTEQKFNIITKKPNSVENANFISYAIPYPNPFFEETKICISLVKTEKVKISILDSKGLIIKNLYEGKMERGFHYFVWNPTSVSQGIYFLRFQTQNGVSFQKLIFLQK